MKHKNNHTQTSKADVMPLAEAWWKRHPTANLLDIESAIQKMTQVLGSNGKVLNPSKKGPAQR